MKRNILAWILICAILFCVPAAVAENTAEEPAEWKNILLLGGDSRSETDYGRTDAMIILSVCYENSSLKLTSVMRDIWVQFPETEVSHKINAANIYGGPELAIATVNRYFGTDIEDYVMINMSDLVQIVDMVGGVELTVNDEELAFINLSCPEEKLEASGDVHLSGAQALAHTRDRSTEADYGRVMRQQQVLLALGRQLQNMDANELMDKVGEIMEHVQTSLDTEELKELATVGMIVEIDEVLQFRLPADGTYDLSEKDGLAVLLPNFTKNKELLREFIYVTEFDEAAQAQP